MDEKEILVLQKAIDEIAGSLMSRESAVANFESLSEMRMKSRAMTDSIKNWRLVPLVPTDEMIVAFAEGWYSKKQAFDDPDMLDAYAAMLAVAPDAPEDYQAARIAELERMVRKLVLQRLSVKELEGMPGWSEVQHAKALEANIAELKRECEKLREDHDKEWRRSETNAQNCVALSAELEACRKDAERYRWIRERAWYVDRAAYVYEIDHVRVAGFKEAVAYDADDVEAAIDAAMHEGGV